MTLRKLNPTDLANLAAVEKISGLRKKLDARAKSKPHGWSYLPIRGAEAAIYGASAFPGLGMARLIGHRLDKHIVNKCWNPDQLKACQEIADLLSEYVDSVDDAVLTNFDSLFLGWHGQVSMWSNLIYKRNGKEHIWFPDYRRDGGLTSGGRLVMFSAMHHLIRMNHFDLIDAELVIHQYRKIKGKRELQVFSASQLREPLLTAEELTQRFALTVEEWRQAQERAA